MEYELTTGKRFPASHATAKCEDRLILSVALDYELPRTNVWVGKLFGAWYAKWCVEQMLEGTSNYFNNHKRSDTV